MNNLTTINKNFTLIRADSTNGSLSNKNHTYFMYDTNATELVTNQYTKYEGNKIHTYKTTAPLKLLNVSNPNTIKFLLSQTQNENTLKSIQKSFRLRENNKKIVRSSKVGYDIKVSKFICSLGYDGYYASKLPQKYGTKLFHQEIMLCNPKDKLRLLSTTTPNKPLEPRPTKRKINYSQLPSSIRDLFSNF